MLMVSKLILTNSGPARISKGRTRVTAAGRFINVTSAVVDSARRRLAAFACTAIAFSAAFAVQPVDAAPAAVERCLRGLGPADVFIDLKRDELSIVVANLRGTCDVIVNDMGMSGSKGDIVNLTFFELVDTASLSNPAKANMRRWNSLWPKEMNAQDRQHRLEPGEALVRRTNMVSVMREIEAARERGQPRLPWGKKVLLTITANVFFTAKDEDPLGIPDVGLRHRRVTSTPFVYRLPAGPNATMRQVTDEVTLEDIEGED